jgi:hypothetical protein
MDEQEHSGGQEPAEPQQSAGSQQPAESPAPGGTSPITMPAAGLPQQRHRGVAVRKALTSRGAGWVVAAVLAGAVVALSVVLATSPSGVAVQVPLRAVGPVSIGPGGIPAFYGPPGSIRLHMGAVRVGSNWVEVIGPGQVQKVGPGGAQVVVPSGLAWRVVRPGGPPGPFAGRLSSPFGPVVFGTVGTVSSSSFTITGPGQPVTVDEQSSTVYRKVGNTVSASAVTSGARVAVLGTQNGSKISAIAVAVLSG